MSKIIVFLFFTSSLFLGSTCVDSNTDSEFELLFYANNEEMVLKLGIEDITCFDWQHQSVRVSGIVKNKLINMPELLNGSMVAKLNGDVIYEVDIVSEYQTYEFGKPKITFENNGIYFIHENWILIRYLKNKFEVEKDAPIFFEQLVNEELFDYLKKKEKLRCKNWTMDEDVKVECCKLDLEFVTAANTILKGN